MLLPLKHSELESRRFGLSISRGVCAERFSANEIVAQIYRERIDIAILRIPASNAAAAAAFESYGIPSLTADTLVYYDLDLSRIEPTPLRNSDLVFERLESSNVDALDNLVEKTFSGYRNHYSANPLLNAGLLPGYMEWARSFAGLDPERFGWLVSRGGRPVAFAACSRSGSEGEGVLYGVSPVASGGGVYGDLIRFTQRALKDAGCSAMKESTQVQNFAVQKVWSREGFVMKEAFTTVHLNALLSCSVLPRRRLPLVIAAGDVDEFACFSGDRHLLPLDKDSERAFDHDERMAHNVNLTGFLSRFYGSEVPGEGTVLDGIRCTFYGPVYPDREYSVEISFPYHDHDSGCWRSVARVVDSAGRLCLLAYADLSKRGATTYQAPSAQ